MVGSVFKVFTARNRRKIDLAVVGFEREEELISDRTMWGLPTPNREAAFLSLAKYAKTNPVLSESQVDAFNYAAEWMSAQFFPYMCNSRVKGVKEVVEGLDKTTSPGFPWTRKYPTKALMLENEPGVMEFLETDWDALLDPKYTAVFGNSIKEEIRRVEKIKENSQRTFTAGPIEMTVHGNRLFEDQNQKFYDSFLRTASVVGFSPLKGGWDALYQKLAAFAKGFALDESQYDSSLRFFLMWAIAEFRWSCLRPIDQTPENKERLLNYYRNLVNTLIITSDGVFILKQGGNPSGSVNTIVDNTLILYFLMAYAWIRVAPPGFCSYVTFEALTRKALCGDDNTWTVSEEAIGFYNARSVIHEWGLIGVTTTTDSLDPRPLEELDFLSAHTVFVDGFAIPLYDRSKLLASLLYSKDANDPVMTLTRTTALMRVAWADPEMILYLNTLASWLVTKYGPVLHTSPAWLAVVNQIPTDKQLRRLFLGTEGQPLELQSMVKAKKDKTSTIKRFEVIERRMQNKKQMRKPAKLQAKQDKARVKSARKKVIKKEIVRVGGPPMRNMLNPYLKTLIDPERYSGVRYPDPFPRLTGTTQGLLNYDVYTFPTPTAPAANPPTEIPGTFLHTICPVMVDPVFEYADGANNTMTGTLNSPSESYGLFPLAEDGQAFETDSNQLFIRNGETLNMKVPMAMVGDQYTQPLNRGFDPDGNVFYGRPWRTGGAAGGTVVSCSVYVANSTNVALSLQAVTEKGPITVGLTKSTADPSGSASFAGSFLRSDLAPALTVGTNTDVSGLPGIGFRLISTSGNVASPASILSISLTMFGSGLSEPVFRAVKFPDEDTYVKTIDQYRVVSASAWLEYQGAELTNGGQVAGIMYRGGKSSNEVGFWNYDFVAETPGGFQGPVKTGTYSFWMPANERDMLFRSLDNTDRWSYPYMVNVGLLASPDIQNVLRLRVPMNFEFVSTAQFYQYKHADIHPEFIAHAAQIVSTMQTTMENPNHWQTIKDYLRAAANTAVNVGNWVWNNKAAIGTAAAAIGALL